MLSAPRTVLLPAFGISLLFASEARAEGELLFAECTRGSVVDISGGGDLTERPRFATGFRQVNDVCVGPGGRIYVAACTERAVFDITEGGDFAGADPFASGLGCAVGLYCDATHILVADYNGRVIDVSDGGDYTDDLARVTPYVTIDVLRDDDGRIWASTRNGILDVTEPGNYAASMADAAWTDGGSYGSFGSYLGQSFVASYNDGGIYYFNGAGDLTGQRFADNVGTIPGAVVESPFGAFVSENTVVFEVTGGGDFEGAVPYATALQHDGCLAGGGTYVHYCGDGFLHRGFEECDDGNLVDDDACSNACTENPVPEPEGTGSSSGGDGSSTGAEEESGSTTGGAGETGETGSDSGSGSGTGDTDTDTDASTGGSESDGSSSAASDTSTSSSSTSGGTSSTSGGTTSAGTTEGTDTSTATTIYYDGPLDDDSCNCDASRPRERGAGWLLLGMIGWFSRRRRTA